MSSLLNRPFEKASSLPPEEQDAIAVQILDTLAYEALWHQQFSAKLDVLRRLEAEAASEADQGQTRPLDELLDRA